MANRLSIILAIIVITLGYAVFQSMQLDKKLASDTVLQTNSILMSLPSVKYSKYNSTESVDLNTLNRNHTLIIHFWATWCAPCEREFPQLMKLVHRLQSNINVKFLFVSVNDKTEDIKKFLTRFKVSGENIIILEDKNYESQKLFGTYKLPETFVFKANTGLLVKKFSGPQDWTNSYFSSFFSSLSN